MKIFDKFFYISNLDLGTVAAELCRPRGLPLVIVALTASWCFVIMLNGVEI